MWVRVSVSECVCLLYTCILCYACMCTCMCMQKRGGAKSEKAYHWREPPQASFVSQQKFWHNKHVGFFLLRQKYACCNNKNCHDKIMFVATKLLSQQIFVATNLCLSQQILS